MNKIRIATNEKALTVRLPDNEAEFWFGTLCRALLNEWPQEVGASDEETAGDEESEEDESAPDAPPPVEEAKPYKGFMHIICEHCGDVHSFCAREPITQYRCTGCGKYTPLHDLRRMFLNCECGKTSVYWTNATAQLVEMDCLHCKMPVTLERDKQGKYVSL